MFSGTNNSLSRWGVCVTRTSVPPADALSETAAQGCPVPCNPRWSAAQLDSICGADQFCCQTNELESEDCALDPELGVGGCWRPVTGEDLEGFGGLEVSSWSPTDHATHQDPAGRGCEAFAAAVSSSVLSANGINENDVLKACYRRLSVADLRGFCTSFEGDCPLADPSYVDACERLNLDEGRVGCE